LTTYNKYPLISISTIENIWKDSPQNSKSVVLLHFVRFNNNNNNIIIIIIIIVIIIIINNNNYGNNNNT
jgi:hypothetical protein